MDRRHFLQLGPLAGAALAGCRATPRLPVATSTGGLRVLTVEGTPYERGRAHGLALRTEIHAAVQGWRGALSNPEGMGPGQYLLQFTSETEFMGAMARHTPDLLHEIQGIASGSGLALDTILALQLLDEEWCYAQAKQFGESGLRDKCSLLALARDARHPTFLAQNLDGPDFLQGHLALVRHVERAKGLDVLVLTLPGGLALNGMNARGVALGVNTLLTLRSARKGLPVACVVRGALRCKDLAEAARFVQGVPHASGQSYTLGDPERVLCFEASAGQVVRVAPSAAALAHTNHPLENGDLGALGLWIAEQPAGTIVGMLNSEARLAVCRRHLELKDDDDALESLKAALGSHEDPQYPVCRHPSPPQNATAASTIFELRAGEPRLHVAAGPPCTGAFHTHGF